MALRNLEIVFPEKSHREHVAIFDESLVHLSENLFYLFRLPRWTKEEVADFFEIRDFQNVYEKLAAQNADRRVIMTTAHYGPFELMIQAFAVIYYPAAILARGFGLPRTDRWWDRQRGLFGNSVFARLGGYRVMLKQLEANNPVAMLVDQNIKRKHAVFVSFFGRTVAATKAPAIAALRLDLPMLFVVSAKVAQKKYRVYCWEITRDKSASPDDQIHSVMQQIHTHLEEVIREHPHHWFWIHRRFKTQPEGVPEDVYESC